MSSTFQVGQTVMVTHRERGASEVEVTKVGRTLVYAAHMAFYVESGAQRRHPNAAGYGYRIRTLEQYAEQQERIRLRGALSQAGIRFADWDGHRFTTSQLERLLAVAIDSPEDQS